MSPSVNALFSNQNAVQPKTYGNTALVVGNLGFLKGNSQALCVVCHYVYSNGKLNF